MAARVSAGTRAESWLWTVSGAADRRSCTARSRRGSTRRRSVRGLVRSTAGGAEAAGWGAGTAAGVSGAAADGLGSLTIASDCSTPAVGAAEPTALVGWISGRGSLLCFIRYAPPAPAVRHAAARNPAAALLISIRVKLLAGKAEQGLCLVQDAERASFSRFGLRTDDLFRGLTGSDLSPTLCTHAALKPSGTRRPAWYIQ